MKISICIATCNKPESLDAVLWSIRRQHPSQSIEIVIVDDSTGSDSLRRNRIAAKKWDVDVYQQTGNFNLRNSAYARNLAVRLSTGDVLLNQSDEVFHITDEAIEKMYSAWYFQQQNAVFATVYNAFMEDPFFRSDQDKRHYDVIMGEYRFVQKELYTGKFNPRPFFFLGMVSRELFYKVGGNDEEFNQPAYEDDFLAYCLHSHGANWEFLDDVVAYHIDHTRLNRDAGTVKMKELYDHKLKTGQTTSSNGPWKLLT